MKTEIIHSINCENYWRLLSIYWDIYQIYWYRYQYIGIILDEMNVGDQNGEQFKHILNNELDILHLIHHRNKNQHKTLVWWRHLDILRRYMNKLINSLESGRVEQVAKYIHKRCILEKAYREFNGIIALGQFITLGLTLVAIVLRIWSYLERFRIKRVKKEVRGNNAERINRIAGLKLNYIELENADDIGEEIDLEELGKRGYSEKGEKSENSANSEEKEQSEGKEKSENSGSIITETSREHINNEMNTLTPLKPTVKRKKQTMDDIFGSKKKKKVKKLKKKNAMDDIFG